jgi:hypothetical protein
MLDRTISIAIMLFILSMISERLVTWIKLYYGRIDRSLWLFTTKRQNLRRAPRTKEEEKCIEVKVLGLNIVVSIFIAIVAHASLLDIISGNPPYESIGWNNVNPELSWKGAGDLLLTVLGCSLTGLFMSLGSKFWHDLADLLLYSKNLKQKLSDAKTFEVDSIDQLKEFLDFSSSDLAKLAIVQNETTLKTKFPNIEFLNDSIAIIDGDRKDVVGIYLSDNMTAGLPDKIPIKLPSGQTYAVPTKIIGNIGKAKVTGGLDGSLSNDNLFSTGSTCCIVKDDTKHYLLTNCHVLTDKFLANPLFDTGNAEVRYENKKMGTWAFGAMNSTGDFALIAITDIQSFLATHEIESFSKAPRLISKEDYLKLKVTVRGNICKTRRDVLLIGQVKKQLTVSYKNGDITFDTAILIGDNADETRSNPVSDFGDSGGAAYDEDMNLIGIITAKGNNFTYVIPIADFLNAHHLQIH